MNALRAILEADAALAPGAGWPDIPWCWPAERRVREDFAECERLPFRDMMRFAAQGVSAFKLLGFRVCPAEMGAAAFHLAYPDWRRQPIDLDFEVRRAGVQFLRGGRILFASDKRAEPEKTVPAFVMPAIDDSGAVIDLVAWHPPSGRIGSSERAAGWLAGGLQSDDEPVIVHPDPLAWLRASREGVVIVHEDIARPALLAQRTLQAADLAHGEALDAMLRKVRVPRIVVPALLDETMRAAA